MAKTPQLARFWELRFQEGRSNKFYRVALCETNVACNWGRIGSEGTNELHSFPTPDLAWDWADKKVMEKLNKGYSVFKSEEGKQAVAWFDTIESESDVDAMEATEDLRQTALDVLRDL